MSKEVSRTVRNVDSVPPGSSQEPLLRTDNLEKYFERGVSFKDKLLRKDPDNIHAVDGVNLQLDRQSSIGVIGESGCGKTTLLRTLIGLHDPTAGDIVYKGKPTREFTKQDWKEYRKNVQITFQDPFNSLNPKKTIRATLREPLKIHGVPNKTERILETLNQVELRPPERFLPRYPPELSGGELQRASIARALVLQPDILLADEPVSMLDVSTQASILKLLSKLKTDLGVSIIYISHDLSTVSYVCDEINVMYLGRIIERARTERLIQHPKHPYSQALINSVPIPDPDHDRIRTEMEGSPSDPINLGEGCRFRDRCPERMDICEQTPAFRELREGDGDHHVACHLYEEGEAQ